MSTTVIEMGHGKFRQYSNDILTQILDQTLWKMYRKSDESRYNEKYLTSLGLGFS